MNMNIDGEDSFVCSGERKVLLSPGSHMLFYRVTGTAGTPFKIEAKQGATMRPVDRKIPDDGKAGGQRTLLVEAAT
jgi:hypothetical protein